MMMMSERTPLKYTSRLTSRKRWKLGPEEASTSAKKRAIKPTRHTPLMKLPPSVMRGLRRRLSTPASARGGGGQPHVLPIGRRRVMKRQRTVDLAVDKLSHVRQIGAAHLLRGSFADNHPFGDEVQIIDNLQRLEYIVGHPDRGVSERVVELADQLPDHRQRDRI